MEVLENLRIQISLIILNPIAYNSADNN